MIHVAMFAIVLVFSSPAWSSALLFESEEVGLFYQVVTHPCHKELVAQLTPLRERINTLRDENDVHKLDDFVFGKDKQIRTLSLIGDQLKKGKTNLSLAAVRDGLKAFVTQKHDFVENYPNLVFFYGKPALSKDKLLPWIDGFFSTLVADAGGVLTLKEEMPYVERVASLGYSLAWEAFESKDYPELWDSTYPMYRLLNGIIEDRTTGGCPQGRANRIFRETVAILEHIGLNQEKMWGAV